MDLLLTKYVNYLGDGRDEVFKDLVSTMTQKLFVKLEMCSKQHFRHLFVVQPM